MSLLVPAVAPVSPSAQNISESSSTGSESRGDSGFSSHFEAQQGSTQRKSSRASAQASSPSGKEPRESASKSTTTGSASEDTASVESRETAGVDADDKSSSKQLPDKKANTVSADADKASQLESGVQGPLANKGRQNAPAVGLADRASKLALPAVGEQVLSLLATDGDAVSTVAGNSETPMDSLMAALGGNESPQRDEALPSPVFDQAIADMEDNPSAEVVLAPLAGTPAGLEQLPVQGGEQPVSAQQVLSPSLQPGVSALDTAIDDLPPVDAFATDDLAELNPLAFGPTQISERLPSANPALSALAPSLVKTAPGKQSGQVGEIIDVDVESNPELDLPLNPGKTIRAPLFDGGTAAKLLPSTQAMGEAVANSLGAKDSFEQVRQNIMATMAGKSEIPNPLNLAVSSAGHEVADSTAQNVNTSSLSTSLSAPSVESAKYTATQEITPQRAFTLQTPAGQPGWDVEVGNRIRWMVGQNNTGVELRLNPPELGSIEVKVANDGERTSITFFSTNPAARDTLEAALPRLREMFADSGMQLANADVSDQGLQQQREHLENADAEGFGADRNSAEAMIMDVEPGFTGSGQGEGRGTIDYYI